MDRPSPHFDLAGSAIVFIVGLTAVAFGLAYGVTWWMESWIK